MLTYTHRNINTGKLCRIVQEINHDGHTIYYVMVEGQTLLKVWNRDIFKEHHVEVESEQPDTHAAR